jgi:hypothetical protein
VANPVKVSFLEQLRTRYGKLKQLPGSLSLFEIGDGLARLYVRYSKLHLGNRTFFGLRRDDLKQLAGINSVICFLWDNLNNILDQSKISTLPDFSQSQIQTIIGSIGTIKGHDI